MCNFNKTLQRFSFGFARRTAFGWKVTLLLASAIVYIMCSVLRGKVVRAKSFSGKSG